MFHLQIFQQCAVFMQPHDSNNQSRVSNKQVYFTKSKCKQTFMLLWISTQIHFSGQHPSAEKAVVKSVKEKKVNLHLLLICIEKCHKYTTFGREHRLRPKTVNTYNSPSRAQSQRWFMVGWDTPEKAVHHCWRVLVSARQMNSTYWIFKAGFVTLLHIFSKYKLT